MSFGVEGSPLLSGRGPRLVNKVWSLIAEAVGHQGLIRKTYRKLSH